MSSKTTVPITTALCVSASLIGYVFYQRHAGHSGAVSPITLCVFIAVIFVVPAAYDVFRRVLGRNKTSQ